MKCPGCGTPMDFTLSLCPKCGTVWIEKDKEQMSIAPDLKRILDFSKFKFIVVDGETMRSAHETFGLAMKRAEELCDTGEIKVYEKVATLKPRLEVDIVYEKGDPSCQRKK